MKLFKATGVVCLLLAGMWSGTALGLVNVETVLVGNPGNAGEVSGRGAGGSGYDRICGAVSYTYRIGKYEITAGQYGAFLNAVARTDTDLYALSMGNPPGQFGGCGIHRTGSQGSYSYSVDSDMANRPVTYVSWYDAVRFANWMHNGQPNTGVQDLTTTQDGSYYIQGVSGMSIVRKPNATWVLPTEDEWYKAAYHKNDGVTGNYWDYPTGTNTPPSNDVISPDPGNNANYFPTDWSIGSPYFKTVVGEFENSDSPYGTFDQGGNVDEWNETIDSVSLRGHRGASYFDPANSMVAAYRSSGTPENQYGSRGFRLALMIPPDITLTMSVSPVGAGTTTPAVGGPYPYNLNEVVNISAVPADGYRFIGWLGGVENPQSATTTVTMSSIKSVTAVFEQVQLTMAASPAGTGATTPAIGAPHVKNHNEVVSISALPASGNAFDHWDVSTGAGVADPYSAETTVTMDVNKTVTAVFRLDVPTNLILAIDPPNAGTTAPAVGTYPQMRGETVSISVAPNIGGNVFAHWKVSDGSPVADPLSPTTTVTMDAAKTVTAEFKSGPQLRGLWTTVFYEGMRNEAQVDAMIQRAVQGGYNAIFAQVQAYHDAPAGYPSHGAYWRSNILPKSSYVTETFDPLAYMVERAHANGLELHAWLVAYRVTTDGFWPPTSNAYLNAHPEFLMGSRANTGLGPTVLGSGTTKSYVLDPGSPDVQEYLVSVVRELVTNYAIDGINWDYIRYDVETTGDGGYPSSNSYTNSGLARFRRIYKTAPDYLPPITGDTNWDDFRRRSITELVRRCQMEIESITSNPRQPLRHSADLITWSGAPASFEDSSAWKNFSNWKEWMELGFLDAGTPMVYYREHESDQKTYYQDWVKACLNWRYQRHMFIGQANYLNYMDNSLKQMRYALHTTDEEPGRSADGIINYSYYHTKYNTVNDYTWYTNPVNVQSVFANPAPLPSMPWRSAATATEGRLWGRVTREGLPVDNATVQVSGRDPVKTDGNGIYAITMLPAAPGGTNYDVTAANGIVSVTRNAIQVTAGSANRADITVCSAVSADFDHNCAVDAEDFSIFEACAAGPGLSNPPAGCSLAPDAGGFIAADLDRDRDVDQADFGLFQRCYTDDGSLPDPNCAN